jgi:hypothetical protein
VPGTVTDRSAGWGFLEQSCDFTRDEAYHYGVPEARDTAKVTGRDGTSEGRIVTESAKAWPA